MNVTLPIVTLLILRLTRWSATPSKVTRAFWPGVPIVTATDGPSATIVAVMSAGTPYTVSVTLPVSVPW
jgi:hypothetical protein